MVLLCPMVAGGSDRKFRELEEVLREREIATTDVELTV